jgi:hypothetical protein
VSTGKLLGIGAFALATGLSVNALRYYDELDLLPRRLSTRSRDTGATARSRCGGPG